MYKLYPEDGGAQPINTMAQPIPVQLVLQTTFVAKGLCSMFAYQLPPTDWYIHKKYQLPTKFPSSFYVIPRGIVFVMNLWQIVQIWIDRTRHVEIDIDFLHGKEAIINKDLLISAMTRHVDVLVQCYILSFSSL